MDIPNHLTEATIYRYYDDPGNKFSECFSMNLFPMPNILYILFCGWDVFPTVEVANKVFISLCVILLPISVLLLIMKLGGNRWYSLLSFLLVYNYCIAWGHVGFAISIPFLLLFFLLLVYSGENRSVVVKIILAVFLLLLFFMHPLSLFFGLLMFFVFVVYFNLKSPWKILSDVVITAPAIAMLFIWSTTNAEPGGESNFEFLLQYFVYEYTLDMPERLLAIFAYDNHFLFREPINYMVAIPLSLPMLGPVIYAAVMKKDDFIGIIMRDKIKPVVLLAIISIVCYMFLPDRLEDQYHIYQRFSVFILLSAILLGSLIYGDRIRLISKILIIAILLIHFGFYFDYMKDFDRVNSDFTAEIFPSPMDDGRMGGMIYDYMYRGGPSYIHFPNYYLVWKHGIPTSCIFDYRFGVLGRKEGLGDLPKYNEYLEYTDGKYTGMKYLLVRDPVPEEDVRFLNDYTRVKSASRWSVYEYRPE